VYSDADLLVAVFFAAVVGTFRRVVAASDGLRQAHRTAVDPPAGGRGTGWEHPRSKVTIRT
jgi:hypothetical protein